MDKIEALIKRLQEAREELNKNVNASYSAAPNMSKDEVRPDKGFGKITIKEDPKPVGKVILKEEMAKDAANPALAPKDAKVKMLQTKIDAGTYKPDAKKIADKMLKDEAMMMGEGCTMKELKSSANGQWSMKKGAFKELESKLEHEGKSKESAGAIAYSVGKEKYGKKGMEAKAEAAKKSDDDGMR